MKFETEIIISLIS